MQGTVSAQGTQGDQMHMTPPAPPSHRLAGEAGNNPPTKSQLVTLGEKATRGLHGAGP